MQLFFAGYFLIIAMMLTILAQNEDASFIKSHTNRVFGKICREQERFYNKERGHFGINQKLIKIEKLLVPPISYL